MSLVPFESRYLKNLHDMIMEEVNRQVRGLAKGTQINRENSDATAQNVNRAVGVIEGLEAALKYMDNVNDDMTGRVKKPRKDED